MIKAVQNLYHYCKYGEVVHRSPSGKVIRKKTNHLGFFKRYSKNELDTTKTIINKNGNVESQINRYSFIENDFMFTVFNKKNPNIKPKPYTMSLGKEYSINNEEKKIIDYTGKNCFFAAISPYMYMPKDCAAPEITTIAKI